MYKNIRLPSGCQAIIVKNGEYQIPDNPVIPFVEGDGLACFELLHLH